MISVIVPIYNVDEYLEECINSILNQTYKNLEIILVDDGSTDNSPTICDKYEKENSNIKVIHKKNGGAAEARNVGIDMAEGDYIAFIDGDDYIMPYTYETMMEVVEKYSADIVAFGITQNYLEAERANYKEYKVYEYNSKEAILDVSHILISPCNKVYARKIWNHLRFPLLRYHEDEFVYHYTMWNAEKIVAIDTKLYYYRQRIGSTMHTFNRQRIEDAIFALRDRVAFVEKISDNNLLNEVSHGFLKYLQSAYEKLCEIEQLKETEDLRKEDLQDIAMEFCKSREGMQYTKEELLFIHKDKKKYFNLYRMQKTKNNIREFLRKSKNQLKRATNKFVPDELLQKELKIQIIGRSNYFIDYADTLCKALCEKKINAYYRMKYDDQLQCDVIIFIGSTIKEKNEIKMAKRDKSHIVCAILTEQPYSRNIGFYRAGKRMVSIEKRLLRWYDLVYVWSKEQYELYSKLHKHVVILPYFYDIKNDYTLKQTMEKKYDLLFLGESNLPHRKELLEQLKRRYSVLETSKDGKELWGEEKYKAISESKICLNIHQETGLIMEVPRLFEYFSNKAFVLSESIKYPEPFKVGEDFDIFYYSDVFNKIDYYLKNDNVREEIAQNGYKKVKSMTVKRTAEILFDGLLTEMYYLQNKKSIKKWLIKQYRYLKWKLNK